MLFKLCLKNIKKSFKDYAIYFMTLILGVAIFYMFNSLDSQQAMLNVSESTRKIIKMMIDMLGIVSVFVSIILGFLIVYANNFLIKRRKKEFGIYMTLGMGRRKISRILLIETILIGIISLGVGLIVGIFGSQLMSILVGNMFKADMSRFEFVFSNEACIKTCMYFGIMYVLVMIFNIFTISRYKLIDLLTAIRKNEKLKIKNPIISIIVFIISVVILGYAYHTVTYDFNNLTTADKLLPPIIIGSVGTFLVFWSLSGFILKLVQSSKKIYLKETNMFVLRQINAKINTTVMSMTIICLMLFVTICVLSSAISLNNSMQKGMEEMTPVDINLVKFYTEDENDDSIEEMLKNTEVDLNKFKDKTEITSYSITTLTLENTFGTALDEFKAKSTSVRTDTPEEIIKVSDYNKIAKVYGNEEYSLKDDEYIILCDSTYNSFKDMRDKALQANTVIEIQGKKYIPKYNKCQDGFIIMSSTHVNSGIILVPDNCLLNDDMIYANYLVANYNTNTYEGKKEIQNYLENKNLGLYEITKIEIYEGSTGLSAIITFIALYLGIIFLISSSAILALKELSESSDNKERYNILRKIGADEKMINKSLFMQIGIFFITPLLLACIHSIFGIKFALKTFEGFDGIDNLTIPIIITALFIVAIYGGYFVATYLGSKRIIKEN